VHTFLCVSLCGCRAPANSSDRRMMWAGRKEAQLHMSMHGAPARPGESVTLCKQDCHSDI